MVWNGTSQSTHDIFLSATAWLVEFGHAQQVSKPVGNKSRQRWQLDPDGKWKLNVDGSYLPNQVTGGLGGVLRDDIGRFRAAFATPVNNVNTAKHTELMAIKDGLQLLQFMQVDNVVLETGCLEATYDISNATHNVTVLGGLIDDIKTILLSFCSVTISHTPRTCNGVAHRLACIAFEARENCFCYTRPPNCIADMLQYDCNHSG
ncbi:uncharacterized protein LOC112170789 [Rosa chinensis]|uniref:uncharacterized protein LOC112170789 n=1 Tax=Rosa chinensis TaxID=74649 RepID=UPI000D0977B3|nr:uncharacterized protein LOC112170789 [Rosa chinensis]